MIKTFLSTILSLAWAIPAFSAPLSENRFLVNRVVDGDTLILEDGSGELSRVRLSCIDAPELRQEFGAESKVFLEKLLPINSEVYLSVSPRPDQWGRIIGLVYPVEENGAAGQSSVNLEMVRKGKAFFWQQYSSHCPSEAEAMLLAEEEAKLNEIGVWDNLLNVQKPWIWRRCNACP